MEGLPFLPGIDALSKIHSSPSSLQITAVAWEVAEESGRDIFLTASVLDSQLTCSSSLDLVAANSGAALLLEGQQNSSQVSQWPSSKEDVM